MECFVINSNEIEGRLDCHFYRPEFTRLDKKVKCISKKILADYILSLSGGATPDIKESGKYYSDSTDGIPFLRVQNVTPEGLNLDDVKFINKETHNGMLKRSQVNEYNLLVKITGVGRMAVSSVAPKGFSGNINQHLVVIKTESESTSNVLAVFLNSDIGERLATKRATGGTRPALDYEALKSIPIVLKPEIISVYEKAIIKTKRIESEAQQLLDSINEYVLDELGIKLPELKDKMVYVVNSEEVQNKRADAYYYQPKFEEIEKTIKKGKFEVKTIGEITEKVTSGATPLSKGDAYTSKEEGIPFIRSGDINEDKNINFDDVLYIKQEIHNKVLSGSKLKRGDVLIAIVGATIGQVSLYDYDKEANINQAIALVRLKKEVNPEFVKAFMLSTLGQKQLDRIKRPVARANINLDEIRSIKIILPSLAIQNRIAEEVKNRMQKAKQLQKEAKEELEKAKQEVEKIILGTD